MPLDVDDRLVAVAEARGISVQAAVREAIVQWVEREDRKADKL